MPYPVDPASLEGDELDRWYRRSPQDVERERQGAANERYLAYFGGSDPRSQTDARVNVRSQNPPDDNDVLWIADGSGGYRAIRPGQPDYVAALAPPARPGDLPDNPAAPEDASLVEVGNPYNRILKRHWEAANGRPWPKTPDGRSYHVSHKRAIADGGHNTLDNIEPMHPDEHPAMHLNNGDSARWAKRQWTARAFGGRVEPPTPRPPNKPFVPRLEVEPPTPRMGGAGLGEALGVLGLIPDILGVLSGRTPSPFHDPREDLMCRPNIDCEV